MGNTKGKFGGKKSAKVAKIRGGGSHESRMLRAGDAKNSVRYTRYVGYLNATQFREAELRRVFRMQIRRNVADYKKKKKIIIKI